MATTNITITSSDTNNNSVQKTITGINPDATSAQLVSTAQKIVALTDNTYVKTDRVDKTNCDTEASGKQTPTLTLSQSTVTLTGSNVYTTIPITYDGDGQLYAGDWSAEISGCAIGFFYQNDTWNVQAQAIPAAVPGTVKIMATETANYKAVSTTLTFVSA